MNLLLDTHVCVWWATDPAQLHADALSAIGDPGNSVWFSAASAWELSIKVRSGKLSVDVLKLVGELIGHGLGVLGIGIDDGIIAGGLDWTHRDPFDRMLAAQSQRLNYTLITRDRELLSFLGGLAQQG